jgi:hypothetical protein
MAVQVCLPGFVDMRYGKLLGRKIRTALSLSRRDRRVLWEAWVLLLAVDLVLRVLSFSRVQGLLAARGKSAASLQVDASWPTIRRLEWLVRLAACNHLYPMRCIQRSLVLQRLLRRHGIMTSLRIGVRKEGDGLCAHAWLEHDSQPIERAERTVGGFAPLMAQEVDS